MKTSIQLINDVDDKDLWSSLLSCNLVAYAEENIIKYFHFGLELESLLITFINGNDVQLNFSEMKNDYGEEVAGEFFDAILVCNELSNQKYREILTTLELSCDPFDREGISVDKFQIITDESIIQMNLETHYFIREHYQEQALYFIERNINNYISIMTTETIVLSEIIDILSINIEDAIKIKLLEITNGPISIVGKRYSDTINAYVLQNNLDANEIPHLFLSYKQWATEVKQIVFELARDHIDLIINTPFKICSELLRKMLESEEIEGVYKLDLFLSSIPNLDVEMCRVYLEMLNLAEYNKVFEPRTRPKYEINTTNEKILSAFKKRGWINDYENDGDRAGYYKLIRNRPILRTSLDLL